MIAETKRYDPANGLKLTLGACDLDFLPGSTADVEYASLRSARSFRFVVRSTDANIAEALTASNTIGCESEVLQSCRRVCLVKVTVPPGATGAFTVDQASVQKGGAVALPVITVQPGAVVPGLRVGAWWKHVPTLSARVDNATINHVSWYAGDGDFVAISSAIASASLYAKGSGSIYLLDIEASGRDVEVKWRQPNDRFCAATDLPPATAEFLPASDAWDQCDIRSILDGTDEVTNYAAFSLLRSTYDADSNGRVTKEEFTTALSGMRCCGGSCPHASWCERESFEIGFADPGLYGLSVNAFARRLLEANKTMWFPKCKTVGSPNTSNCLTAFRRFRRY